MTPATHKVGSISGPRQSRGPEPGGISPAGRGRSAQQAIVEASETDIVARLAGGIAQDFNALLTIIIGYSDAIADSPDLPGHLRGAIKEVQGAANRAAELTARLLLFSRHLPSAPVWLDMAQVMADMETVIRRLAGADVIVEMRADASGWIHAMPGHLQQVLLGLVSNARDAMPDGGCLTVTAVRVEIDEGEKGLTAGTYALLEVSDTGCGIEPDMVARIFDPMFTTKETGNASEPGLSAIYGIVRQMGGAIEVESARSLGATFQVYIPLIPDPKRS